MAASDTLIRLLPRRAPRDAYAMHRSVAAATAPDPGRVLWAQPVPDLLVIRSTVLPDWGAIAGAAAACSTEYAGVVSTAAEKLQIPGALPGESAVTLTRIGAELADAARFAAWREQCQRYAVYVTAVTRVRRTARRTTKKESK